MRIQTKIKCGVACGVAVLVWSFSYASSAELQLPVGKITSGVCGSNENQLNGSGVILEINKEKYVATSEHVILATSAACHSIEINGKPYVIEFVFSDFNKGLALLKIRNGENLPAFQFEEILPANQSQSTGLISAGFPAKSKNILIDSAPSIVSVSDRKLFANIQQLLEVKGLHAEYGMSGGALMSADGKKLVGILSHLTSKGGITNGELVLVIPSQEVKSTIVAALNGKTFTFRRDPRSQNFLSANQKSESVLGPGIRIQSTEETTKAVGGGGDGMGIGGTESNTCKITIQQTDFMDIENGTKLSDLMWMNQIKELLHKMSKIEIEKIVRLNADGTLTSVYPQSISDLIREMQNPDSIILIKSEDKNTMSYRGSALLIINDLLKSNNSDTSEQDMNKLAFASSLLTIFNLKVQNPGIKIPEQVISKLYHHNALREITIENFDQSVIIRQEISHLSITRPGF